MQNDMTSWSVYPRPQMVRKEWICLNGTWQLKTDGKICSVHVPYCLESKLSGYDDSVVYGRKMTYRRSFTVPKSWSGKKILLHFGAVNRKALIRINGQTAAVHENGYLPFVTDITEYLRPDKNVMTVSVVNDLSGKWPWGKQKKKRGGMWYTPVSGIWQTVWMEPVPEQYIRGLQICPGSDAADIAVDGIKDGRVILDGKEYLLLDGKVHIHIENPQMWSPEDPHLYRFSVVGEEDCVESYFALRTLTIKKVDGIPRLCLNGKPYYFHGLLDQGYWSDGLYTPPEPADYEKDILSMKALGFNTLRKHIKIEAEQYYYDCDRLGMIVFQDMVNNGDYAYLRDTVFPTLGTKNRKDIHMHRDQETRKNFIDAMDSTVRLLGNHPCICLWTIFNEGWGQFCADELYDHLKQLDPSRFVDSTSGWFHQTKSDVDSHHQYFEKLHLGKEDLPQLLSEIGGWSLQIKGHCFNDKKTYSYRVYKDRDIFVRELRDYYLKEVIPLIRKGLCGSIYTQVSDVEDETNGLITFDRQVQKLYPEDFLEISEQVKAAVDQQECR